MKYRPVKDSWLSHFFHPVGRCAMAGERSEATEGNGEGAKPIVLILVGVPGSGKSTFCENVMKGACRQWVRVCQDIIAKGKSGTKSQCLRVASDALKEGKSVLIDRCNLEREQRLEFIKLGDSEVDVHAVVLDLPVKLCISRSVKRTEHEGGLQGGKAAAVVNRILQKREMPMLSEGFSRITFCHADMDVENTVHTYSILDPFGSLLSGCFGQRSSDAKVQVGIMKFLKKLPPSENSRTDAITDCISKAEKPNKLKEECSLRDPEMDTSFQSVDMHVNEIESETSMNASVSDGCFILAFPSISTSDFQFSLHKASDIIVEKVTECLKKTENIRLILVDLREDSKILSMVNAKAMEKKIDPKRFSKFVGDITHLYSRGGLRCNVIANAANWRLRPGGGGVNAAIFNAAGEDFERVTKNRAQILNPGNAVAVPLPAESPLSRREGITHVIHVLGPNMNPQRPNYLGENYVKGCDILRKAYESLFDCFASIVRSSELPTKNKDVPMIELSREEYIPDKSHDTSFLDAEHNTKRNGTEECASNSKKKCMGFASAISNNESSGAGSSTSGLLKNDTVMCVDPCIKNQGKKIIGNDCTKAWASWAQALYRIVMHPDQHKNDILGLSEDFIVLNDLYPKAKKHLLVVARVPGLDSLANVHKEHITLLRSMHAEGQRWIDKFTSEDPSLIFRLGYHSVPSMRPLHLHIISQDFDSVHLKHKKHWNSFNTPFFLDSVDVIEEIDKNGKVTLSEETLLSKELRCPRCRSAHPNLPRLKSHIKSCHAPFPANLLSNGRLFSCSEPGEPA